MCSIRLNAGNQSYNGNALSLKDGYTDLSLWRSAASNFNFAKALILVDFKDLYKAALTFRKVHYIFQNFLKNN